jgi:hypothetical protein
MTDRESAGNLATGICRSEPTLKLMVAPRNSKSDATTFEFSNPKATSPEPGTGKAQAPPELKVNPLGLKRDEKAPTVTEDQVTASLK